MVYQMAKTLVEDWTVSRVDLLPEDLAHLNFK